MNPKKYISGFFCNISYSTNTELTHIKIIKNKQKTRQFYETDFGREIAALQQV